MWTDAQPVPGVSQIGAGFSASFQFRSDVVEAFAARTLRGSNARSVSFEVPFAAVPLTTAQMTTLRAKAQSQLLLNPKFVAWTISANSASAKLTRAASPATVAVVWDVRVLARVEASVGPVLDRGFLETAAKLNAAIAGLDPARDGALIRELVDILRNLPSPSMGVRGVEIYKGQLSLAADCSAVADLPTYRAWVEVPLAAGELTASSSGGWEFVLTSPAVAGSFKAEVGQLLAQPLQVTPPVSLSFDARPGEHLRSVTRLDAVTASTAGNVAGLPVLHLALETDAGVHGDASQLKPAVGDATFASFYTEAVAFDVIKSRWSRPDITKSMTFHSDVVGMRTIRRGEFEIAFTSLDEVGWEHQNKPFGDAIRLGGQMTIKVLKLFDAAGVERDPKIVLGAPNVDVVSLFDIPVDIFNDRDVDHAPGTVALDSIVAALFLPLLSPVDPAERYDGVRGYVSAPAGAVWCRGDLQII